MKQFLISENDIANFIINENLLLAKILNPHFTFEKAVEHYLSCYPVDGDINKFAEYIIERFIDDGILKEV